MKTNEAGSDKNTPTTSGNAPLLAGVATLLTACGGSNDFSAANSDPNVESSDSRAADKSISAAIPIVAKPTAAEASRFLQQAQFGGHLSEIGEVREIGYVRWLESRFKKAVGVTAVNHLDAIGYSSNGDNIFQEYGGDLVIWNQLIKDSDPFRARMALALSEFFVVSITGFNTSWPAYFGAAWWDLLMEGAFGNFRQLLERVTLSPGMGLYLNTHGNKKADGRGSQPDENYAREVMQLFSIGLVKLNLDGTPEMAKGKAIEAYGQDDVSGLARCFTGYVVDGRFGDWDYRRALMPMIQQGNNRALEATSFLGATVPANTSADAALKIAIDTLFNHPNVGPFFCRQMIQRLVTSNPSPGYVRRVASVFNKNHNGERGNLTSVWTAIFLDEEARGSLSRTSPEFGKLREPMVRFLQWARTFKYVAASETFYPFDVYAAFSQSPLRSPSVFNFFRPGYVLPGHSLRPGSVLPEFQLVNESSVINYINSMASLIEIGSWRCHDEVAIARRTNTSNPVELVKHLDLVMTANQLSEGTITQIARAIGSMGLDHRLRVAAALLLIMASPEYLIQK